tara:strand:- start:809 stop:2053 length:1245 start_codon:yes stop_codon:yes gene_type:complete
MAKYSDWRSDLREVMDDDTDEKKVTGKGVDNKKLIKINPKLGEAVEQIGGQILEVTEVDTEDGEDTAKDVEAEKKARIAEKNKKKEGQLKKRIVRMKMMAVNQGAGDSLVAHHEPEGELIEGKKKGLDGKACWDGYKLAGTKKKGGKTVDNCVKEASPALAANTKIQKKEQRKKDEKEYARLMAILAHQKDLKKRGLGEEVVDEGVMKFIKDRVGGKKKPEKKAEMDKTTEKLHDLRKDKFKTDKQKEHEKYVNFLDVDEGVKGVDNAMRRADAEDRKAGKKTRLSPSAGRANVAKMIWDIKNAKENAKARGQNEEVVTELNRFGKETGKATGSLNKRPGSSVATRNEPGSAVNIVRRMIRKDTGRPEGQQKKVKGAKGSVQPGDRKFTPAQTISRMRAQVAAADAAMRDTRGT